MSILMIVIVLLGVILALYMMFLLKLTPKKPRKQDASPEIKVDSPPVIIEDQSIHEEPVKPIQTRTAIEEQGFREEPVKPIRTHAEKKSFYLFGQKGFEGCVHKFEYLKTLPKNTPIPDECFGCPQIIECLGTRTKKRRKSVAQQYYQEG